MAASQHTALAKRSARIGYLSEFERKLAISPHLIWQTKDARRPRSFVKVRS
jgi:hypothetical protein